MRLTDAFWTKPVDTQTARSPSSRRDSPPGSLGSTSALGEDSASLPEVPRGPGDNGLAGRSDGRAGHDRSKGPKAGTLMRRISHFLDQWFGDADGKRLSVPERFASLEAAVSEANNQLNSLTRMPLNPAGLGTRQTKSPPGRRALSLTKNRTRRPVHEEPGWRRITRDAVDYPGNLA